MEVLTASTRAAEDEVMSCEMERGIAGRRWALCRGMRLEGEEDLRALSCA
jgi:hypothetical protein